jgi:hypothetical protein
MSACATKATKSSQRPKKLGSCTRNEDTGGVRPGWKEGVPQGALPCVVFIIGGILLVMLFLFLVLKNSGQS